MYTCIMQARRLLTWLLLNATLCAHTHMYIQIIHIHAYEYVCHAGSISCHRTAIACYSTYKHTYTYQTYKYICIQVKCKLG